MGCTPKLLVSENNMGSDKISIERIIDSVKANNIEKENFFIEKASVLLIVNNRKTRLVFNTKYVKPDEFMFSIRNNAGIEGARVYISNDTLLINDRVKRKVICGKPKDFEKYSGIPYDFLRIMFGDIFISGKEEEHKYELIDNKVILLQQFNGKKFNSVVDNHIGKVISASFLEENEKEWMTMSYSKHRETYKKIPQVIEIKDFKREMTAKIKLEKIQIPWDGVIEFIPGKGYNIEVIK
jgi:hypothetical protein